MCIRDRYMIHPTTSNMANNTNPKKQTITFTQTYVCEMTYKQFKNQYEFTDDDTALKVWNKMLENTDGKHQFDDYDDIYNDTFYLCIDEVVEEAKEDIKNEDGFENCDCGYIHHYEDKCPRGTQCEMYEKWRVDDAEDNKQN